MIVFLSGPQTPGGRIRGLGFPRIGSGGRSPLRSAKGEPVRLFTPVEPLLHLLDLCAER